MRNDKCNVIPGFEYCIDEVNNLVDEIENFYANEMKTQKNSNEIGDMVLDKLKKLDLIAYIRFASVYKDFTDVESFIKIISELNEQ